MQVQEFASVRSGSAPGKGPEPVWYVQLRNVAPMDLVLADLTDGSSPERSGNQARLAVGDVVVALRGTTNVAALVDREQVEGRPLFGTLDLGIVRLHSEKVNADYLAAFINLPKAQAALANERSSSSAPRLSLSSLQQLDVPVPSLRTQHAFAAATRDAARERELQLQIVEARERLLNELLAVSIREAAEEPVPGCNLARVSQGS